MAPDVAVGRSQAMAIAAAKRRRALTEDEIRRLLATAQARPLEEALTVRHGARTGELSAKVRPVVKARLETLGLERALVYKTLVLTGLRRGELASLTVGQLELDSPHPHVALKAADAKNRKAARIPLRADLVADLRAWLARKLEEAQREAKRDGEPVPSRLALGTPLFWVPKGLGRILERDLAAAGIPKRDERGYTADVHALRRQRCGTRRSTAP